MRVAVAVLACLIGIALAKPDKHYKGMYIYIPYSCAKKCNIIMDYLNTYFISNRPLYIQLLPCLIRLGRLFILY